MKGPKEPVGRSDEAQQEERSPEAMACRCPTKAEPEGRGSPVELMDRRVTVEARELGAEVELPDDSGGGGRSGWEGGHFRGAGTGGHFRGVGTGCSGAPSGLDMGTRDEGGLDGTSGYDGERRGGDSNSSSVSQSIKSPSMSSSPRRIISSPSATVQGAELHSALTPSTAGSLVVGTVAGSRT